MSSIGVTDAAERLGVSRQRVLAMIRSGLLPAVKIGNSYNIDAAAVARHRKASSRPLSPRMATALLELAAHEKPEVTAPELSRLRHRLNRLRDAALADEGDPVGTLRDWLASRARRMEMSAAGTDLTEIAQDPRLTLSGVSDPRAAMLSGGIVEGYVREQDAEDFFAAHFIVQASSSSQANVIAHITNQVPPLSALLVAADLADHREGREERQARTVLREWAKEEATTHGSAP